MKTLSNPILIRTSYIPLILPIIPISLMHQAHVVPTRLLMRRVIHCSPLDAAVLRHIPACTAVIHLMLILTCLTWQSLDAVVASDARSESRRVACAAGLAVGEGAEFGAEVLFEE
jgi:hypothetical protein